MKKLVLVVALSATVAAPAMAMESKASAFDDTQQIFRTDSQPLELSVLSQQEMKETEGAVLPVVVVGAITGAAGSTAVYLAVNRGKSTWRGAAIAAGSGALVGSGGAALMAASGGGLAASVAWRPAMAAAKYSLQKIGNGTVGRPGSGCTGGRPCPMPK